MHYRYLFWAFITALALLFCGAAGAATRYVSDQLSINMRRGPGVNYRISQLLDAGDKLQTLSETNGWTRVRIPGGATGYVLTRFLSDQPPARVRLDTVRQQMQQLKSDNADLKQKLNQLLPGAGKAGSPQRKLLQDNASLKAQLQKIRETSADAIRIGNENEQYRRQLLSLKSEIDRLKHENTALQNRHDGMKIGALIMLGGIVIGLVLSLFRRRRRGNWDSL